MEQPPKRSYNVDRNHHYPPHCRLTKKINLCWPKTKRDQTIDNRSQLANQYEMSVGNETSFGERVSLLRFNTDCLRSRVYQTTEISKIYKTN